MKKFIAKDVAALAVAIAMLMMLMLNLAYGQTSAPEVQGQESPAGPDGRLAAGDGFRGPGHPAVPPPEAFDACKDKTAGSAAQFTTPRGETIQGTCREKGDRLVLVPDRPEGRKLAARPCPPPPCNCPPPMPMPPPCCGCPPPPWEWEGIDQTVPGR